MPSGTTQAPEAAHPTADEAEPAAEATAQPRTARQWRPGKSLVSRRLEALAQRATVPAHRQQCATLARRLQATAGSAKRAGRIDAAVAALLADADTGSADGLLLLEAATWVVAWRQGSKHAGSTASLEATLLAQADEAEARLREGDTGGGAFVLAASRLLQARTGKQRSLAEAGVWTACEAEIMRLVTSSGVVSLDDSAAVVSRVARWTHIRETAAAAAKGAKAKQAFARKAEQRWKKAIAAALRLLGPGGKPVPTSDTARLPAVFGDAIVQAAASHGGKAVRKAASLLRLPSQKRPKRDDGAVDLNLDDRQAAVTVLRSSWQGRPVRVLLDYRSEQPHLEVAAGSRMLLHGPWQWQVHSGRERLSAEGPWTVSHHEEDDDVTLLVIAATLTGGLRLERHLLLGRADRVMLLADAVVDAGGDQAPTGLSYRGSLPVAAGCDVTAAAETRELTINDTKPQAMLMPLALPEWNCGHTEHTWGWQAGSRAIHLEQRSPVRRLFAPVWVDLAARRFRTQVTWRQLTVADTRVILRPEQAAGFRIQAALTQWLLYRSLDEPRNRTFLGCNLSSFFRLGKLGDDGLVSQMAEW